MLDAHVDDNGHAQIYMNGTSEEVIMSAFHIVASIYDAFMKKNPEIAKIFKNGLDQGIPYILSTHLHGVIQKEGEENPDFNNLNELLEQAISGKYGKEFLDENQCEQD